MGATKETPVAASLKWSQGAEALNGSSPCTDLSMKKVFPTRGHLASPVLS